MKLLRLFSLLVLMAFCVNAMAQTARVMGLRDNTPRVFAFTNAEIVVEPGRTVGGATLVIRDGIIEAVGRRVSIPADATQIDLNGAYIYPGFIDMYANYGIPDPDIEGEQIHWNPQIRSHFSATSTFRPDEEMAVKLRAQGFVVAHTLPSHGLLAGQGSVVSLGEGEANRMIIRNNVSQALSFRRSMVFGRGYPTSAMGGISLIRQSFLDAEWHEAAQNAFRSNPSLERPEYNMALAKLHSSRQEQVPFVVDANDFNAVLRASALADEFGLNMWIRGGGDEYKHLEEIRQTGKSLILPLNFPRTPDVSTPEQAINISLEALRHWYLAPENPSRVARANIAMALTSHGNVDGFIRNLKKAVERGLDTNDALAALTTTPASMLGIDRTHGTLEAGKVASFIISDKPVFENASIITQVWVDGKGYPVVPKREDSRGKWLVSGHPSLEGSVFIIEGTQNRLRGSIEMAGENTRMQRIQLENSRLLMGFQGNALGMDGVVRLSANISTDELLGVGESASGEFFTWTATRIEKAETDQERPTRQLAPLSLPERFPSMEYGLTSIPRQVQHVLVRNATIWTQGAEGILEGADMLITNGKIAEVGFGLSAPRGAQVVDASGKHVTPGLIDPHIHSSVVGGVNETGDAITAEVRITDVLDANTVWIYRLLAGGITSATIFHGSANPIGGQNAVIKMRWGKMPADLIMEDAAPGLKMALGENVKGSTTRYPNTRQGVEQIMWDNFQAAVEYGEAMEAWKQNPQGMPIRRDLTLEPILEVIKGERSAHVHAYRQDEMLMTIRLAEEFGFTIATFEHGLEAYKIADELKAHGAAAVVWSDWSAFKVESYDGILYNARILDDVGVLTTLHSDNTQLSTRMNWEAAKTMKTGVDQEDAMKFITLNPAIVMGIDHRVGSLENGKDGDFVIWNGHPLSAFSSPDQTWIEGTKLFDREEDMKLREEVKQERAVIIGRILEEQQAVASGNQETQR